MLTLKSSIPGLVWPAVPSAAAMPVLAYLTQLEASQWLDARELAVMQARQLASRLTDARVHCALLRECLSTAPVANEANARALLGGVPLLTRSQLQDHSDRVFSSAPPQAHGSVAIKCTSGSTGQPVNVRVTAASVALRHALLVRGMLWHGLNFGRSIAMIRTTVGMKEASMTEEQDGWGQPVSALVRSGRTFAANIRMPVARQLAWLDEKKPDYLMTYPSNLAALLGQSERVPANLEKVVTIGETLSEHVVDDAKRAWGIEVLDTYSSEEFGPIATQCKAGGPYHVMAEGLVVEVLRDDGSPCEPGATGRVVITDVHNFATGMIRYETGDHAEVGGPCTCGRGLPTLARILGRTRNMITMPDGSRRWPSFGLSRYGKFAPIKQFQMIQHTPTKLELRLHAARPLSDEERSGLVSILQQRLGYAFDIELNMFDGALPRAANGKFEAFVGLA